MILNWFTQVWEILNKLHPETRTLIIILLFGWILYSQITDETKRQIEEKEYLIEQASKKAD